MSVLLTGAAIECAIIRFMPKFLVAIHHADSFDPSTEGPEMAQAIDDLNDAAEHLASIRDVLLPKLVTGQIDVSSLDLDAAVEASVA